MTFAVALGVILGAFIAVFNDFVSRASYRRHQELGFRASRRFHRGIFLLVGTTMVVSGLALLIAR